MTLIMTLIIIGLDQLLGELSGLEKALGNPELVTEQLDDLMQDYVPVVTGYLQSTIYHDGPVAGASAPYAGIIEEMGGHRAYGSKAIEAFSIEGYADKVWEVFG